MNEQLCTKTYIGNKVKRNLLKEPSQLAKLLDFLLREDVKTIYDLGEHQKLSLISCEIETGRTHQIRVHAKLIGCPIFGDKLYKLRRIEDLDVEKTILSLWDGTRLRQMLHAHELSFVHPKSRRRLFFRGNLPLDFSNLLSDLNKYKAR